MKKDILVVYASEYGSTGGVANAIANALSSSNTSVDVKPIKEVHSLENYKHVIIGSPIQYDTWMDEAKQFVKRYEKELAFVNVDYFFTCLTLSKKSQKAVKQAQKYADDLVEINSKVTPIHIGQFAGVLDYSKFSFSFRVLAHVMFAVLGVKEGDYRDWSAIKKWSNKIKG